MAKASNISKKVISKRFKITGYVRKVIGTTSKGDLKISKTWNKFSDTFKSKKEVNEQLKGVKMWNDVAKKNRQGAVFKNIKVSEV